jgi:hypothetical protein
MVRVIVDLCLEQGKGFFDTSLRPFLKTRPCFVETKWFLMRLCRDERESGEENDGGTGGGTGDAAGREASG